MPCYLIAQELRKLDCGFAEPTALGMCALFALKTSLAAGIFLAAEQKPVDKVNFYKLYGQWQGSLYKDHAGFDIAKLEKVNSHRQTEIERCRTLFFPPSFFQHEGSHSLFMCSFAVCRLLMRRPIH